MHVFPKIIPAFFAIALISLFVSYSSYAAVIATGKDHTCAIVSDASVKCWGANNYGQLGNGTIDPAPVLPGTVKLAPDDKPMGITAGQFHTCALMKSGVVKCWGRNNMGQLGNGDQGSSLSASPVLVKGLSSVKTISAGFDNTCAIGAATDVWCWGANNYKQIQNSDVQKIFAPISMGIGPGGEIAAGEKHICNLLPAGYQPNAICRGSYNNQKFGGEYKTLLQGNVGYHVSLPKKGTSIFAGGDHVCTLLEDGTVSCWGSNDYSQLGNSFFVEDFFGKGVWLDSNVTLASLPVITNLGPAKKLALGSDFTCALDQQNGVSCLGRDFWSPSLGRAGPKSYKKPQILTFAGNLGTISDIFSGPASNHLCVIGTNRIIQCVGKNSSGQLGGAASAQPSSVATGFQAVDLAKSLCNAGETWSELNKTCGSASVRSSVKAVEREIANPQKTPKVGWFEQFLGTPVKHQVTPIDKQQTVPPSIGSGGQRSTGKTEQTSIKESWMGQKSAIAGLVNELITTTMETAVKRDQFQKKATDAIEPYLDKILKGEQVNPPKSSAVASSKAAYDTALQKQKDAFVKINNILSGLLKLGVNNKTVDAETRDALTQIALAYFNAILVSMVDGPLVDIDDASCAADPVQKKVIYNFTVAPNMNDLVSLINALQCMPQIFINKLDQAFITAFDTTMKIIEATQPNYLPAIKDKMMSLFIPVVLLIHEKTKLYGENVPTKKFINMYRDRLDTIAYKKQVTDTGINIYPMLFMLYNTTSKKAEILPFCNVASAEELLNTTPGGKLLVWSDKYACMIFKNFIKAVLDPELNKDGTCPFWDTTRVGKPCVPTTPKTSFMQKISHLAILAVENLWGIFESSAWAYPEVENNCNPRLCKDCMCTGYGAGLTPLGGNCSGSNPAYSNYTMGLVKDCSGKPVCVDPCYVTSIHFNKNGQVENTQSFPCNSKLAGDLLSKSPTIPVDISCLKNASPLNAWPLKYCEAKVCGDGTVDEGEECDDGNKNDFDTCRNNCKKSIVDAAYGCYSTGVNLSVQLEDPDNCEYVCDHWLPCGPFSKECKIPMLGKNTCENYSPPWEIGTCQKELAKNMAECAIEKEKCLAICGTFISKECPVGHACCPQKSSGSICGNWATEPGEECDDGNTKDGDGCSSNCKKKKWCEQCYNVKFSSKNCDFYDSLKEEYKNNPNCKTPYTSQESEIAGCYPIKKGQSCAYTLLYFKKKCNIDWHKNVDSCFEECSKKEGPPPHEGKELTEEEKKACLASVPPEPPSWLNNFGSNVTFVAKKVLKEVTDLTVTGDTILAFQGKKDVIYYDGKENINKVNAVDIFEKHWPYVVELMQEESGITFHPDSVTYAAQYAREVLSNSTPCDPNKVEFSKKTVALYIHDDEYICWNPNTIMNTTPEKMAEIGAHEALHAAIDSLWFSTPNDTNMSLNELCSYGYNFFDHWMMDTLTEIYPGDFTIKSTVYLGDAKPSFCPAFLKGE